MKLHIDGKEATYVAIEAAPAGNAPVPQGSMPAPTDDRKAPLRARKPSPDENERQLMKQKPRASIASVETATARSKPTPVRVRLQRINCDAAKPYPPQGVTREWWQRLKDALGTASNAFVHSSLIQLIEAAKLPRAGISDRRANGSHEPRIIWTRIAIVKFTTARMARKEILSFQTGSPTRSRGD
jgi:hypothetical protein